MQRYTEAWHQSYRCTGVRHCEYVYEDMLNTCTEYNNVNMNIFNDIKKKASAIYRRKNASQWISQRTESFFHAFKEEWQNMRSICSEDMCSNRRMEIFTRRGVSGFNI